jgi:hypothetical protein
MKTLNKLDQTCKTVVLNTYVSGEEGGAKSASPVNFLRIALMEM